MKKCILVIAFGLIITAHTVLGQINNKLIIIDNLIKIGDLKPIDNKDEYLDNVFIVDLVKFGDASKKEIGIFKFGTHTSHSKSYILLRDKETLQVLSLNKLDEDLLKEISFLKKIKLTPTLSLAYIEATIMVYQKNMNVIPWTL